MKTNLQKGRLVIAFHVCKISGETATIVSECKRVVLVNDTVTHFNLFVCPFKQHDMSVMNRVPNFVLQF